MSITPRELAGLCQDLTVLYVEDETEVRRVMKATLELLCGTVHAAADGQEALSHFDRHSPDLVITDIRMPVMDGFALIRELRQRSPELSVLVVSAHNNNDYFAEAIELDVNGFILKPVQMDQLLRVLERMARRILDRRERDAYRRELERLLDERSASLEHHLLTDELTGLGNRVRLKRDMTHLRRVAAIQVNIDNLEHINTGFGLQAGDWVLQETAALLTELVPAGARIYRLAGDEFIILLPDTGLDQAGEVGRRIKAGIAAQTLTVEDDARIPVIHTLGVTEGPVTDVVEQARVTVADARRYGHNRMAVHAGGGEMASQAQATLGWIHRVRQALVDDRIIVHYQPIIDNRTGETVKYEALARMIEGQQLIGPAHFIRPAQLGGLMTALTARVLDQTLALARSTGFRFSVNITSDDLQDGSLVERLEEELRRGAVAPGQLTLEVLEGITVGASENVFDALMRLRDMGFPLAIDDFGAEHSHFSRIPTMNAEILKIDGQFIRDLDSNASSRLITHAIVQLAKGLGIAVVAEFVHSEVIHRMVTEMGIEYSQGFFLGHPQPEPGRHN